ncbi:hypothetical protein FHW16_005789 [Phyllobacterium myrsinacearum]|uniref:Uncharacterized protein n=1 Tax=Phyllobacterium myrsinacearum TaxID=28101 RepID=A0A839EPN8_9HYPH|nr:hypothetical protein [Phyllobacterium myrsinacearum]
MKFSLREWAHDGRGISLLLVASSFSVVWGYTEYTQRP